jgi:hypothetical protein
VKTLDENGRSLDAEFDIEPHGSGAFIVFHARYGTRGSGREVNIDYLRALEVVLARLSELNATIMAIEVDSRVARGLPLEQRLLPLPYPIQLTGGMNVGRLRRDVTEAQRRIARDATAKPAGGNNHKRIRISLDFPQGTEFSTVRHALSGSIGQGAQAVVQEHAGPPVVTLSFSPYREAVSNPSVAPASVFSVDHESLEKALAGHARVQNALADYVRTRGLTPVSPGSNVPDFDLGWKGARFTVAEVKSLTGANIDRQLRIGLGQVIQYRTLLSSSGGVTEAVLAVEYPVDDVWVEICSSVGVVLTWPPDWPRLEPRVG